MEPLSQQELAIYLDIATEAAWAGAAVLQTYWGKLAEIEEKSYSGDLVTVADRESEAAILEVLQRHFPSHNILAEESGWQQVHPQQDFLWAVDPLDGTTNFAHQYPMFSVSVGLLFQREPVVGVVLDPLRQELFRAAQGLGATCNRQPMRVSRTDTLERSLLVTGFAYDRRETPDNNYAEFCHLTHRCQGIRRGGSAALDLAYVACGRLDGYWERGLSPWDIAAGIVLVREAGGLVTAYDGNPVDVFSGRLLATNGWIHAALSQALTHCTTQVLLGP
ncbi:MAG: inositol monophosphatase family protein [Gloeomargarita sp. SKYBB_i_bin120]|nr:inositol monophosphatase [Gloeomargarita sp. SKYG98]MCS7291891.1 inositol monophosphatase [Gloeomargarita sp. SKYB120]MDW8177451.1 inositol monophosphatase family protein [Gloeomargarita sp. SKYBB_i_bin120]